MTKWVRPVIAPVNQRFNNGGTQWVGGHPGTDYPVEYGRPVLAASDGIVRVAGQSWDGGFGYNPVCIYHPADDVSTTYGHLEDHTVSVGQTLSAGTLIGHAGAQGVATGPHLHLEGRPGDQSYGMAPPQGNNFDMDVWLHAHGAYADNPIVNPDMLKPEQRMAIARMQHMLPGVKVDSAWGKQTDDALEKVRFFNMQRKGWKTAPPNSQVQQLGKLWGVANKGIWGPQGSPTDTAYALWRWSYLNK